MTNSTFWARNLTYSKVLAPALLKRIILRNFRSTFKGRGRSGTQKWFFFPEKKTTLGIWVVSDLGWLGQILSLYRHKTLYRWIPDGFQAFWASKSDCTVVGGSIGGFERCPKSPKLVKTMRTTPSSPFNSFLNVSQTAEAPDIAWTRLRRANNTLNKLPHVLAYCVID